MMRIERAGMCDVVWTRVAAFDERARKSDGLVMRCDGASVIEVARETGLRG